MQSLLWVYSNSAFIKSAPAGYRQISFRLSAPVENIVIAVRDNRGSDSYIFSEVFDHRLYDFPLPFSPQTILDLGANVGLTTLFFSRKYPNATIACVEPLSNNIDILYKNLELNRVRAEVVSAAIAVADGSILMEVSDFDYGHKVAGINYGRDLTGKTLNVDAISIPTLLKMLGWERINLLKVDIEGYEGVLLRESCEWLYLVDAIYIECHEGYAESDLQTLAKRYGFTAPSRLLKK